jgi:hypothetical protein
MAGTSRGRKLSKRKYCFIKNYIVRDVNASIRYI